MIKNTLLYLLFFLLSFGPAAAQVLTDQDNLPVDPQDYNNLSSPYNTALTFLYNLREDNFKPKVAAKTLTLESNVSEETAVDLVIKLKQIFDGNGIYVRLGDLPTNADYVDSVHSNQQIYFFNAQRMPRVYLEKSGNAWKFSAFTTAHIQEIHQETYPFGTSRLLNLLPQLGNKVYIGLKFWQLVGVFILILMIFVSHKVFTFLVDRGLLYLLERLGYGKVGEKYLLPVARIVSIYLIVVLLDIFIRVLQLPIQVVSWITMILNAAKPFIITIIFYKLVDLVSMYFAKLAEKTESTLDDQLVPLLRKTLKAFVIVIGSLFILKDGLQLDIVPFLTGLSIGGLAFALAAQDTIKNFFGSIMIFIDKPFQVGDWITSGEVDGTVEEVGFRSTRIRTFRNSVTYIPNGKIADATIDNHGLRKYRRFFTTLTITYDTPPELIEVFVDGLREIVKNHPTTRKDYYNIYFNDLSAYSLNIMFYVFFEVPTWPQELQGRHELLVRILSLANELEVRFAFPTQTLHMENFPEKHGFTPLYDGSEEGYRLKLREFVEKRLKKEPGKN
ncbi:mechanosensitive ion channel family protein [Pararhodonellum marinum]|uniref:mechanosensitive ion channel family protein n=1 Tax=Pararhodonellum marinum TaxID=2755358 RepID=UPI00188E129B|nr:mechanosensitive ion channel family protein [Pararhodonellum marinum]